MYSFSRSKSGKAIKHDVYEPWSKDHEYLSRSKCDAVFRGEN